MNVECTRLSNGLTIVTGAHAPSRERRPRRLGEVRVPRRDGRRARHRAPARAHGVQGNETAHRAPDRRGDRERRRRDQRLDQSIETTAYYARVLKDDVPLAVDILADILTKSLFDAEELRARAERHPAGDRRRERHAGRRRLRPFLRGRLPRPDDRPVDPRHAGNGSVLHAGRSCTPTSTATTRPTGMIVVAAGAVDHADLVKQVEGRFGGVGAGAGQHAAALAGRLYRRRVPRRRAT